MVILVVVVYIKLIGKIGVVLFIGGFGVIYFLNGMYDVKMDYVLMFVFVG